VRRPAAVRVVQAPAYARFLERAASTPRALHVVYINTSLRTKAIAHSNVPTVTCTSSNVVQTVLQAFAQARALSDPSTNRVERG
jgi:quinolinate synthase